MDFYDRLDTVLKAKKMSRRQLAIAAGIPESTMSVAFMRRTKRFSGDNILRIAEVLDVPWQKLVAGTDDEQELLREVMFRTGEPISKKTVYNKTSINKVDVTEEVQQYSSENRRNRLLSYFDLLDANGQEKAIELVELVTHIPEWKLQK